MVADFLSSLDKTPSKNATYLWADYVELRCLVHPDSYFTLDNAEEAMQEAADYSADAEDPYLTKSNESLDKLASRWQECEQLLKQREQCFGDAYPFKVSAEYRGIELKDDADTLLRQWYRFLLLASALQYVPRYNALTSAFERASLIVFKLLSPQGAEVHGFWPGAHHYPNDKAKRLTKLAEDLRGTANFNKTAFNPNDRGDGGIDLVAWHPMGDKRNRIPVSIGQCGCSVEDWKVKPYSVGRSSLSHKIALGPDWWQFYFMPLEMNGCTGDWADGTGELPSVIVVDRYRFLNFAKTHALQLPVEADPLLKDLAKFRYH